MITIAGGYTIAGITLCVRCVIYCVARVEVVEFSSPVFQLHVYTKGRLYACTLTHDLGSVLNSAAHLTHLCRVKQST